MKLNVLIAVLPVLFALTACSSVSADQKRLIFVTSTPKSALTEGAQSESAGGAESGSGGKNAASSRQAGSSGVSDESGNGSSSSFSGGGGDSPSAEKSAPLSIGDIVGIYNRAVCKNASLSGIAYRCVNTCTQGGNVTGSKCTVEYNNNAQIPVFDVAGAQQEFYFSGRNGGSNMIVQDSGGTFYGPAYRPEDLITYTMLLDPALSAGDVHTATVSGGNVLNMEVTDCGGYAPVFRIFAADTVPIERVSLTYTLTDDGYITASKQVFSLEGGGTLEMDKTYVNIGSDIYIRPLSVS